MSGITDPTEEYFKDGLWGWDGSRWRKQGLLFGYRATICATISNLEANEGTNFLESEPVPAGELWIIQMVGGMNTDSAFSSLILSIIRSNTGYPVLDQVSCAGGVWVIWTGSIVLAAGDTLKAAFLGCKSGDDIQLKYLGYKVVIT